MTSRALIVVSAIALFGCDVSQKKPETAVPSPAFAVTLEPPAHDGAAPPERSMRLKGPGVSRERQIRT